MQIDLENRSNRLAVALGICENEKLKDLIYILEHHFPEASIFWDDVDRNVSFLGDNFEIVIREF